VVSLRRAAVAFVLGGLLLAAAAPASAADDAIHIRRIDTSGYPNVAVTVSVPGNLAPGAIAVTEDGKPAPVVTIRPLASVGQAFAVVLAIDTSDSVKGAPLMAAVSAAQDFVSHLPAGIGVGVLTFSDRVRVLEGITADHQAVDQALSGLSQTTHGTVLYDAVGAAASMFRGSPQRNIVLLTDGRDVGSRTHVAAAIAAAKKSGAGVFTVGLGPSADVGVLQAIAAGTGGSFSPAAESNLSTVYERLASELSNQYVIVYRSDAPGGAEVTIGVSASGQADRSFIQMPKLAAPPGPGFDFLHMFAGPVGLYSTVGLAFLAMFVLTALVVGGTLQSRRDRHLARVMSAPSADDGSEALPDGKGPAAWIPEPLSQAAGKAADVTGVGSSLATTLERAGIDMTPGELVAGSLLAAILACIVAALVFRSVFFVAVVAGFLPYLIVRRKMRQRIQALQDQLPDVLSILASSMRAGHSFLQALDAASREVSEPSGPEFARVVTEMRLGRPASEALTALGERVGTEEYRWTVLAVNVQTEVGGNLAEILDTLAETVRERATLRRQIKVLSAEGRLSMKIFVILPPLLVLYIARTNPGYMRLLWTTRAGWIMIAVSLVLMVIGAVLARKVVKIDV
jgi:tight adherence protein B